MSIEIPDSDEFNLQAFLLFIGFCALAGALPGRG